MEVDIWEFNENGNKVEHRSARGKSFTLCGLSVRHAVRMLPMREAPGDLPNACASCLAASAHG